MRNKNKLIEQMKKYLNKDKDDVVFFCVGTDRSTGDSFAPLIGTILKEKGYSNVIGDLYDPVHAENLKEKIKLIPKGKIVIAIDAALGERSRIGEIEFKVGSLKPGIGMNKKLDTIGDYHIMGVVNMNLNEYFNFTVLQNTRLGIVMQMAKEVVSAIEEVFPLNNMNSNIKESWEKIAVSELC